MSELVTAIEEIAASLWMKPGTLEQLKERDFLKHKSEYGVYLLLNSAIRRNWVYQRGERYYCYKHAAIELNTKGYELYIT